MLRGGNIAFGLLWTRESVFLKGKNQIWDNKEHMQKLASPKRKTKGLQTDEQEQTVLELGDSFSNDDVIFSLG